MRINNDVIYDGYCDETTISDVYDLSHMTGFSVQATFSNSTNFSGSAKLQASDDFGKNGDAIENWTTITLPVTSVTAVSGDGTIMWNYSNSYYKWLRVYFTHSGGTSDLKIKVNAKGF